MRRLLSALLALCLFASVCFATSSIGQGMFSEDDFRPAISENDLRVIIGALQLSDDESKVVKDLYEAHIGRVRDEGAAVRSDCADLIEEAQLMGDGRSLKQVLEKRTAWATRRQALDKEFLDELRLVLTAEQEARWSIVERELRRMHSMGQGRMLGESIDAVAFITDARIELTPEIRAILERYARAVDEALRSRDGAIEEASGDKFKALMSSDPQQALREYERVRSDRIKVRDLNRHAIDEVAARLDPTAAARLHHEFIERMSAHLALKDSLAVQALTGAARLESLTDAQQAQVRALTDKYMASRDQWIEDYLASAMKVEETTIPSELDSAVKGAGPVEASYTMFDSVSERTDIEPLRKAWRERVGMDKRARTDLNAILTEPQRLALPFLVSDATIRYGELYGTEGSEP